MAHAQTHIPVLHGNTVRININVTDPTTRSSDDRNFLPVMGQQFLQCEDFLQSHRHGGLYPLKQSSNPLKLNYEALQIGVVFIIFRNVKSPWTNAKAPYWKLSGDGSAFLLGLHQHLD